MRVAVVGGTGLVGRFTTLALGKSGHEVVAVARSANADVVTGVGLDDALRGVDAVVDVINLKATDADAARAIYGTATANLLAAESRARVKHHVLLSIVCVDRVLSVAHYAGKRAQEQLVKAGPVPWTILRATQFHEFANTMLEGSGDTVTIPPLLLQPVAASDAGAVLAEVATVAPLRRTIELAGPETQDLVDMARRTLATRGESRRISVSWRGRFGVDAAGEAMLPHADARIAPTTFDAWLTGTYGARTQ
ncbi:MAG TPA: NAD(P)H-binding protein [Gemmatimonadaceae bacterium]